MRSYSYRFFFLMKSSTASVVMFFKLIPFLRFSKGYLFNSPPSLVVFWAKLSKNRRFMASSGYRTAVASGIFRLHVHPAAQALRNSSQSYLVVTHHHGALGIDELMATLFPDKSIGITVGNYQPRANIFFLKKNNAAVSLSVVYETLRHGGCALLAFDAVFGRRPISVSMFGSKISVSESIFELVRLTGVPLLPLTCYLGKDKVLEFYFHAPLFSERDLHKSNQQLAEITSMFFENDLKQHDPYQFNYIWYCDRVEHDGEVIAALV